MVEKKQSADWERIELDYRAGVLSLREIAAADGNVSHVAIKKRADREGWTRDLSARIKAKAEELVNKALVNEVVNAEKKASEKLVVEANAERIATVKSGHRVTSARLHTLGLTLLSELESQSADTGLLDTLGELLAAPDDNGVDKLNDIYRKVISLPSRIDSAKKAAETLRHAIGLERESYGLDDKKPDGNAGTQGSVSYRANMPLRLNVGN